MINGTNRRSTFVLAVMLSVSGPQMFAQKGTAGAAGTTAPTVTGGRGTTTNNPTTNPTTNPNNPDNPNNTSLSERPIFLSGRVMFDDGSPLTHDIAVERVCGATVHTEGHVDSKGRFSFQLGNNRFEEISAADASQSGYGTQSGRDLNSSLGSNPGGSRNGGLSNSETAMWGCDLRAAYPGYRSDLVSLASRHSLDDPDVGTIILHRLTNVQGTTISLTTAEAPKSAQKNFDRGLQAARKGKMEDAEKSLTAATTEYPKYAVAWFTLGQVQQGQNKIEDARKSYLAAIEADKKYVSPYDRLALLAAQQNKWQDAASYSKQAIDLNPVEFPSSFWYNAISNYNLNKDDEALKSGQALLKMDTLHKYPEVNRLLAEISVNKKEYPGAAAYLKAYLQQVPTAKDADMLKQQLLKIEEASALPKQ
jgi:tetratricopeptide (TPR) repeat protein